jgi:hypothetical protein
MALYLTTQHISELSRSAVSGLDGGSLERRSLIEDDE